jgi:hypothetical protein
MRCSWLLSLLSMLVSNAACSAGNTTPTPTAKPTNVLSKYNLLEAEASRSVTSSAIDKANKLLLIAESPKRFKKGWERNDDPEAFPVHLCQGRGLGPREVAFVPRRELFVVVNAAGLARFFKDATPLTNGMDEREVNALAFILLHEMGHLLNRDQFSDTQQRYISLEDIIDRRIDEHTIELRADAFAADTVIKALAVARACIGADDSIRSYVENVPRDPRSKLDMLTALAFWEANDSRPSSNPAVCAGEAMFKTLSARDKYYIRASAESMNSYFDVIRVASWLNIMRDRTASATACNKEKVYAHFAYDLRISVVSHYLQRHEARRLADAWPAAEAVRKAFCEVTPSVPTADVASDERVLDLRRRRLDIVRKMSDLRSSKYNLIYEGSRED